MVSPASNPITVSSRETLCTSLALSLEQLRVTQTSSPPSPVPALIINLTADRQVGDQSDQTPPNVCQTVSTAVCLSLDCFLCRENQMPFVWFWLGWYFTSCFWLRLIFNLLTAFPSTVMREPAEEPQNMQELREGRTQPEVHPNSNLMGPPGTWSWSGWGISHSERSYFPWINCVI